MKRQVELALAMGLRLPPFRNARAGRLLILAYHNVVPPGELPSGERAAQIPWPLFLEHLDTLQKFASVVPFSVETLFAEEIGRRPRVALTFDDAYAGAIDWALPELVRRGLPATVFVAPQFVDGGVFWWDAIAEGKGGLLDQPLRSYLLTNCRGESERIRTWSTENGVQWVEPAEWARCAPLIHLKQLATTSGITFGAHTWSHPNLSQLTREEVRVEASRSIDWLRAHNLPSVSALAYPYGGYDRETEAELTSLGVQVRLRVEGGFCAQRVDLGSAVPRYNVPSALSAAGLELRLRGLRT